MELEHYQLWELNTILDFFVDEFEGIFYMRDEVELAKELKKFISTKKKIWIDEAAF